MNAVEIEQAISLLAEQDFSAEDFPYAFLEGFGNKTTTIQRLKSGATNKSDIGGVLQTNNIHIKVCAAGSVTQTLAELKASPATERAKAKFILATDGTDFEAEDLTTGETVACAYADFPDHFGFFLPLAGISTVKQIRESSFDIRATSRLNRLYVELLRENPNWGTSERRPEMNHFMARLIFCFFAEDTGIFNVRGSFTSTVDRMSEKDASNTHEVISEIFRAMNTTTRHNGQPDDRYRKAAGIPRWADAFPYVNGGLFSGSTDVPRFTKIARSYLIHIGNLDWQKINPDIFGSMIQAVADDDERAGLGMHYTSVPNILKVLNPLFLDDLREKLEDAGDNPRKLLNLRNRMARIRVFDPACGSGNFLVIAYKEMRAIEAEINRRRDEPERRTDIPLTNFRGIELRDFPAEIARLALIIAEFQCDLVHRGQKEALAEFLPLDAQNWITCGNALRLDWLSICPPTGTAVKLVGDDLFNSPLEQAQIDFENEGGETYICGNPPYLGNKLQSAEQKADLKQIFETRTSNWKSLDYVAGWFMKAALYGTSTKSAAALVSTNSICQGQQVSILWPTILATRHEIFFAHRSFKWNNLASNNAGVTVVIVGISSTPPPRRTIYSISDTGEAISQECQNINPYLAPSSNVIVEAISSPQNTLSSMLFGNMPRDGGHLLMSVEERASIVSTNPLAEQFLKDFVGSEDTIYGRRRVCVWVEAQDVDLAEGVHQIKSRFDAVTIERRSMKAASTQAFANRPYRFVQIQGVAERYSFIVPRHSSEVRPYLPVGLFDNATIVADSAFAVYDAPLWNFAILVSKLHLTWIAAVCGKLETRYRYSNTIGWNTFPVPALTEKNKADLARCAEDILLAREAHYPATIAELYDPDDMPANLRAAHERNDEVLERIYIGRRFKNDTERLEKLFELYTKMMKADDLRKTKSKKEGTRK